MSVCPEELENGVSTIFPKNTTLLRMVNNILILDFEIALQNEVIVLFQLKYFVLVLFFLRYHGNRKKETKVLHTFR